jgi:cell wall assembly regulator SMI1
MKKPTCPRTPEPDSEISALLARLETWLRRHRRHYFKGVLPGATAADLDGLESKLGLSVPSSLRALLAWHNGQSADCFSRFEETWSLMSTEQIAATKQELDALAAEPDDKSGWEKTWIPFLDDDAGDFVCLDANQPGAPVREFWQDNLPHQIVAPSLNTWLERMVAAVERGEYHEDSERGTFSRTSD